MSHEIRYGTTGHNNVLMVFEFTVLASEVNPVMKSFAEHDITVTATIGYSSIRHYTTFMVKRLEILILYYKMQRML